MCPVLLIHFQLLVVIFPNDDVKNRNTCNIITFYCQVKTAFVSVSDIRAKMLGY